MSFSYSLTFGHTDFSTGSIGRTITYSCDRVANPLMSPSKCLHKMKILKFRTNMVSFVEFRTAPQDGIIRSFTPDMGSCKILLCTWDREIEKIEMPLLSPLFYSRRSITEGRNLKIKTEIFKKMILFWCLFPLNCSCFPTISVVKIVLFHNHCIIMSHCQMALNTEWRGKIVWNSKKWPTTGQNSFV